MKIKLILILLSLISVSINKKVHNKVHNNLLQSGKKITLLDPLDKIDLNESQL